MSKPFSKFQKIIKLTQNDTFKIQKSKINLKSINVKKKLPFSFQNHFLEFKKVKKQTKNGHFKIKIKNPQI